MTTQPHPPMVDLPATPMIGIIGGIGPYAGLDLVRNIFDQTLALTDQDHLPVALLSLPSAIPDRTEYLLGRATDNPAEAIARVALQLERIGARVAALPCNTAHADAIYQPVLRKLREAHSSLRLLHLIGETVRFLQTGYRSCRRIGVLSTTGTYRQGLYARALEEAGYRAVLPAPEMQEAIVHPAIYHPQFGIKARANPVTGRARQWLEEAMLALTRDGAEAIILGCTELPLAVPEPAWQGVPLVDPAVILARALIREIAPDRLKPWPAYFTRPWDAPAEAAVPQPAKVDH